MYYASLEVMALIINNNINWVKSRFCRCQTKQEIVLTTKSNSVLARRKNEVTKIQS